MANYVIPQMPLTIGVWRFSNWASTIPPANPPDSTYEANLTPGRRVFGSDVVSASFLLVLAADDIRFSEDGLQLPFSGVNPDLVEVPLGSGRYYTVVDTEYIGMGFANEHQGIVIEKTVPWPVGAPPPGGALLLEDGTDCLLEDNTQILLE
jgi:hypothetical protein